MDYSEKLKSPKWQKKRLEVLQRDNFTCCKCGDDETELHVHHLKYTKEPYDAPLIDLQTLCKYCHSIISFCDFEIKPIDFIKRGNNRIVVLEDFSFQLLRFNEYNRPEILVWFNCDSEVLEDLYKLAIDLKIKKNG